MVIDDQQQAEGVQLASHSWQHFNPSGERSLWRRRLCWWNLYCLSI